MIPLKKTYLVKLDKLDAYDNEGGIYIPNPTVEHQDGWKGTIVEHGAGWTEEERKDLIPVGTRVVMSYGKDTSDGGGRKLVIKQQVYLVRTEDNILGVIEDECSHAEDSIRHQFTQDALPNTHTM